MEGKDMRKALDLSGLTDPLASEPPEARRARVEAERARQKALEAECRAKYGKDWEKAYVRLLFPQAGPHDYDRNLKMANEAIYNGRMWLVSGRSAGEYFDFQEKRFYEIYGEDHLNLRFHDEGDPAVCELLLADAIKTGRWKELPDVLQDEYHRRVGGSS